MATIPIPPHSIDTDDESDYPTGDGKPLAETPIHRDNLLGGVTLLQRFFADDPRVYVSGNMFVYYEKGNRRQHVAPDVFVALGVEKDKPRDAYFVWHEAHGPDVVIEFTSRSTRDEDLDEKMSIYQDKMRVREYFLFDPNDEYLDPPLQGHRLRGGKYGPIKMVNGRLPSEVLGLHLERDGEWLRYYNPSTGRWLPTLEELLMHEQTKRKRSEAKRKKAEAKGEQERRDRKRSEQERQRLAAELHASSEEILRLRRALNARGTRRGGKGDAPRSDET